MNHLYSGVYNQSYKLHMSVKLHRIQSPKDYNALDILIFYGHIDLILKVLLLNSSF